MCKKLYYGTDEVGVITAMLMPDLFLLRDDETKLHTDWKTNMAFETKWRTYGCAYRAERRK